MYVVKLQPSQNIQANDLLYCFACRYDTDRSKFIDFNELKVMIEKLGCPQTHLALKAMIREVDEDNDNQISFREVSEAETACDVML